MLFTFSRKLRQVAADPILRRYLTGRLLGRWPAVPAQAMARPPYLGRFPDNTAPGLGHFTALSDFGPTQCGTIPLPTGAVVASADLFDQSYDDGEILSALHRFAWVPLMGRDIDVAAVNALWRRWSESFTLPDEGPAWEAYTAAERAINLLDLGRRLGLPGPVDQTIALLAAHAPAIAERLEYFGERGTHNHLANNGRGLYRLGCDLALPQWADVGAAILRREAERLFLSSGVLREGSSHYHLLYTRNIADCWLAARRAGRPEAEEWRALLSSLFAVLPQLALPGALPLVGDISPDSPPSFLAGLLPGGDADQGWTGLLAADERAVLVDLRNGCVPVLGTRLVADGWLRHDHGRWSGLWYAAPSGWCFSPGHGHQDMGSCQLHFAGEEIFIDPGRGAYGEEGEAALYRSASAHGLLQVDDADPYPTNKPYYTDAFRHVVAGLAPELTSEADCVRLAFDGFARLTGVGRVERRWCFHETGCAIDDSVAGSGAHDVVRRLISAHPARLEGDRVHIQTPTREFVVQADGGLTVRLGKRWVAYGEAAPAWIIETHCSAPLPWRGRLTVEIA